MLSPLSLIFLFLAKRKIRINPSFIVIFLFSLVLSLNSLACYLTSQGNQLKIFFGSMKNPLSPPLIFLTALLTLSIHNSERLELQRKFFEYGVLVLSILTILEFLLGKTSAVFGGRTMGLVGNPVYLGSILALGAVFMLSAEERKSAFEKFLPVLPAVALATTGTRVAIAAFAVSSATLLVVRRKNEPRIYIPLLASVLTFVLLFLERVKSAVKEMANRLDLYLAALKGVLQKPLTGHGFSQFEAYFRKLELSQKYLNVIGEVPDSCHSALLDFSFAGGILSFMVIMAFFVILIIKDLFFGLASLVIFKFSPISASVWIVFVVASSILLAEKEKGYFIEVTKAKKVALLVFSGFLLTIYAHAGYKVAFANYYDEAGIELYEKGYLSEAIDSFEKARSFLPYESKIYLDEARIFKEAGISGPDKTLLRRSVETINRAIEVDTFSYEAHILKADVLSLLEDKEGVEEGNIAVYLSPYDANSYYYRGLAKASIGDLKGAERDWKEAIRLKENFADAYYSLGYLREIQKDNAGAEIYYLKALKYAKGDEFNIINEAIQRIKKKR